MNARRLRLIMWKEFVQLRRDPLLLRLIFLMPILQLLLFGYVVGADVRNLQMAVVDNDHTALSRQLVNAFSESGYFIVAARPSSESSLPPLIDSGNIQTAIVIDRGTQNAILNGRTAPIGIVVDGADSKTASVASGYAAQIIAEFNRRQLGLAALQARGPGVDGQVRVVFNPSIKAINSMIPGLIAFIVLLSITSVMSQAVVRERARGTLEQMFVTPMTRGEYLLGKVLPYSLIASVQAATVALVGTFWFHVPFYGNVFTVIVGLGLFMLTAIGLGLLVSLVSRTQQQAQQTVIFILLPMMILSGFVFPIEAMPAPIVPVTFLIPLRYALVVLRGSYLKGATIAELWAPLLAMVVFAVVIFGVAVARFSKRLSE